jgi:peptidoglycan hydrolase-like protein with peptidoglycan-binding domain
LILAIVNSNNNTYSPSARSPSPTPRYEPTPTPRQSTPSVPSSAGTEDMPFPGDGSRLFTQGNIRWCFFQDRRLEIMRRAVQDLINSADIRPFNTLVEDYNDRCGSFRYREVDMAAVRAELLVREADIQSQAEQIMSTWPNRRRVAPYLPRGAPAPPVSPAPDQREPPRASLPPPPPASPDITDRRSEPQFDLLRIEDATTVQQRLTELGFFSGKPDGIWSRRARQALREFKSANGLPQDDAWDEPTQSGLFAQSAQRKTTPNPKQSKVPTGPDTYYPPPPGTTTNPLNRADAINLQNRLAALGFFAGQSDGVWGPGSRNALRAFKIKNDLAADDEWNADTERTLAGEQAVRAGETFLGRWGDDAADCLSTPIQISEREAKSANSICKFGTVRREDNGWRIQAVCTAGGETWSDNVRLSVSDGRLTWSTDTLTKVYMKCEGG